MPVLAYSLRSSPAVVGSVVFMPTNEEMHPNRTQAITMALRIADHLAHSFDYIALDDAERLVAFLKAQRLAALEERRWERTLDLAEGVDVDW